MDYKNEIFTIILTKDKYIADLKIILNILSINNINEIELFFGCGWGEEYKEWTPYIVLIEEIENEIHIAELNQVGEFGNDDLFISIKEIETEILFCHEMDIHLSFNDENKITNEIIDYWEHENYINFRKKTGENKP